MSDILSDPLAPAEPVAEPAEPAWAGPSADEWGQVTQTLGYLADLAQQSQAPQEQELDPRYAALGDPFNDQFGPTLAQELSAIRQEMAQYRDFQQSQQLGEAEERALDIIEDDVSRNGEFMLGEKAFEGIRALANVFMSEESQRYGYGPKAAESALARAASEWRAYEKELAQKAIEQHMNQLTNLAGAGREPGASSPGVSQQFEPLADEMAVLRKFGGY